MSVTDKKHLITGGMGFIGSALVRRLVSSSATVRVLDNGSRGDTVNLQSVFKDIEILQGDIRDPNVVRSAAKGCDSIWHLAAVNGTENFYKKPGLVLEVGVKGIVNVLDAVKTSSVENLFIMSSSEVYQSPPSIPTDETAPLIIPDPWNPRFSYGASKIISEMMGLHADKDTARRIIIIRPHNIYGPAMGWEHVIPQLIAKTVSLLNGSKKVSIPIQGDGTEIRAYCFVSDMVDGLMMINEKGIDREIYHVGNPMETSVLDLVKHIGTYFGVETEVRVGAVSQGSTRRRCPNIKKMQQLGFIPKVTLREGIQLTAEWYRRALENGMERKAA